MSLWWRGGGSLVQHTSKSHRARDGGSHLHWQSLLRQLWNTVMGGGKTTRRSQNQPTTKQPGGCGEPWGEGGERSPRRPCPQPPGTEQPPPPFPHPLTARCPRSAASSLPQEDKAGAAMSPQRSRGLRAAAPGGGRRGPCGLPAIPSALLSPPQPEANPPHTTTSRPQGAAPPTSAPLLPQLP